jgi:hypothetical protein
MVHCPETYSYDDDDEDEDEDKDDEEDEDDEDDEDDVIITSGLQNSLKITNYASDSSYCNATNDYDNNNDDASSSSNHSTIGDGSGGVSNDNYDDNDNAKDANHEANNNDATNGNESSICDGTHSKEDYTSLSCNNQSLQPNVSASESSSFIGHHCNPQWNARSKVKSYNIGEEPSNGENKCSIPMNVYLVLVVAVNPLPQSLICLNQLPSHLSMVLVGSRS